MQLRQLHNNLELCVKQQVMYIHVIISGMALSELQKTEDATEVSTIQPRGVCCIGKDAVICGTAIHEWELQKTDQSNCRVYTHHTMIVTFDCAKIKIEHQKGSYIWPKPLSRVKKLTAYRL